MNLQRISKEQALSLAADVTEQYSPGYLTAEDNYYRYKETYTTVEQQDVTTLTQTQLDGLTPIDPTKPMFPKKPK